MVTIPLNSSLVSIVWNRQPFLNKFIPPLILEKFFRQNMGFFYDFFAYFTPYFFTATHYHQNCMPIPQTQYQSINKRYCDDPKTHPFFLTECGNRTKIRKMRKSVIMDMWYYIIRIKSLCKSQWTLYLTPSRHQKRYRVHPFFSMAKTLLESQDF